MNKSLKNKRIIIVLIVIAILVLIDKYTKILAETYLSNGNSVEIIKGALRLDLLPGGNQGAAWGMFSGHQIVFVIIASLVCLFLLVIIYNIPADRKFIPLIVFMTMIISGGIGNMIDRVTVGTVTDFISFYIINFPFFNVADMYVSVSTVLFIIFFLFIYKEEDLKEIENSVKGAVLKK